ncbi:hypothetical protein KJ708_13160, partial [bacterium]|nr:hypothetical protein [bacterium]
LQYRYTDNMLARGFLLVLIMNFNMLDFIIHKKVVIDIILHHLFFLTSAKHMVIYSKNALTC